MKLSGFGVIGCGIVDAVLDDAPVLASGEEAALVTRVLAAIEQSAQSLQPVELR